MTHENSLISDFIFDQHPASNDLAAQDKKHTKKKKKVKKGKKAKKKRDAKPTVDAQLKFTDCRFDELSDDQKQRVVNMTVDAVFAKMKPGRYSYHGYALSNEHRRTTNRDR